MPPILQYELFAPESDGLHRWYVATKGTDYKFVLTTNNVVESIDGMKVPLPDKVYFESEIKAHASAHYYYSIHGELYPYMDEWKTAIDAPQQQSQNGEELSTTIQSEEFKF